MSEYRNQDFMRWTKGRKNNIVECQQESARRERVERERDRGIAEKAIQAERVAQAEVRRAEREAQAEVLRFERAAQAEINRKRQEEQRAVDRHRAAVREEERKEQQKKADCKRWHCNLL